jgi:MFS transporter, DHA2 family, multidrug resistance protein
MSDTAGSEAACAPPVRLAADTHHAAPAAPRCRRPYIGIAAVLLGALISTLFTRVTSFGLADLRGAVHAGVDEGAWITTAATIGQMSVGPLAAWLGLVFGVRRVLLISAGVFAIVSALTPFASDLPSLLAAELVLGLTSGTFIPLTIGFVLQSLPPALWPYGIAAYGLNLELSLNIPASLEGYYLDHLSWHWIYWQGSILALPMLACIHFGMPRAPVNREALGSADVPGMLYLSAGFSMLYAAIDQGNRLDWLGSPTVCALLGAGALLIVAFVLRELSAPRPWINLNFLTQRNIALLVAILVLYRFVILATIYVIPQYLTAVQNFRSLQVGDVLIWIALPQFIIAPLIAGILRFFDPRYVLAAGLFTIGVACVLATGLTPTWASDDFLPSQILQAFGQSAALIALVLFMVRHLRPADALTFGVLLQTARLFGGEVGTGFMQTFVRVREQTASYLIGLHLQSGTGAVTQRLSELTQAALTRLPDTALAQGQAASLVGAAVRTQANVLSYIDGFAIVALAAVVMLVLTALLRAAPAAPG